ncbi:hypothetical protein GCM10022240_28750 [Microbacterium kribbense]|uniref:CYTH domain-containing protein n=1 Tax=Microbacterium kribbense TaxID=433645 RepID=A0ABP7H061_9MICO
MAHSVEIERKYDVDEATALPDWTRLPGITRVGEPEPRDLDARYLDTPAAALAHAGIALRRRAGGPDAGWHVKTPGVDGRHEYHWPLGRDADEGVPADIAAAVSPWATGPFVPLARIRNARVAYALFDASGAQVAEVVDDHVSARNERSGGESAWREWEVELGPVPPGDVTAFFAGVDELVASVGGRPAASTSKLARALSA